MIKLATTAIGHATEKCTPSTHAQAIGREDIRGVAGSIFRLEHFASFQDGARKEYQISCVLDPGKITI
jgi:hypothetical protein